MVKAVQADEVALEHSQADLERTAAPQAAGTSWTRPAVCCRQVRSRSSCSSSCRRHRLAFSRSTPPRRHSAGLRPGPTGEDEEEAVLALIEQACGRRTLWCSQRPADPRPS